MVEDDDREVIEQVLAGSEAAFRQILDRHAQRISNYVRRMTNHTADVEDIVQETFIRFWTSRDRFDPGRVKLTTWLHRIAHHLCIDNFRRRRPEENQRPQANQRSEEDQLSEIEDHQAGPDDNYELSSRAAMVRKALTDLPERQRSAIVLCHYQNFSNREAATILGLSVDALESLLRRARSKLKENLAEELK